jgi:hypothetical protein
MSTLGHGRQWALRRISAVWRDEAGSATVELVIVMPVLFTMIMLIGQWVLWAHATHIAQTAASEALSATRVYGGTPQAGQAEARGVLTELGQGPLARPDVAVTEDANTASVTITGTATAVVPFLTLPVHAEATGPREEFRAPSGEPPP